MPNFVGREHELGWLGERLASAGSGHPQTVVVEGPAGIGKSALLGAFTAGLDPAQLLDASGDEDERFLAFGLLQQLTGAPSRAWEDPFDAGADLLRILDDRSDSAVTVFTVDDAHLADAASLKALTFAMRRLRADRVLLVVTTSPDDVVRLPQGLMRLVTADDNRLRLTGLTDREVADLVRGYGHDAPSRAVVRLRRHTDGNPLHLRTLLLEAPEAALTDDAAPLPAPESFARTVLGQLANLSTPAQALARAAAVVADGSALSLVAAVAGLADAGAVVEELDRSGLAHCRLTPAGWSVRFAHPLVRAAVTDGLGPSTRATLHRRAAEQLTGDAALLHRVAAATGPDRELSDALARRARETYDAGQTHRAAELMVRAARTAAPGPTADERLLEALNLFLVDGDIGSAKSLDASLGHLPPTAQLLYLRSKVAWLAGRPTDAEALALEAWSRGAELESDRRGGLAAILAQLCNLRGDGLEAATWSQRALALDLPPDLVDSTEAARALGLTLAGHVRRALDGLADIERRRCRRAHPQPPSHRSGGAPAGHRRPRRRSSRPAAGLRRRRPAVASAPGGDGRAGRARVPRRPLGRFPRPRRAGRLAGRGQRAGVGARLPAQHGRLTCAARGTGTTPPGTWPRASGWSPSSETPPRSRCAPTRPSTSRPAGATPRRWSRWPSRCTRWAGRRSASPVSSTGRPSTSARSSTWAGRRGRRLLEEFDATARERGSRSRLAALARLRGEVATARRAHRAARDAFEEAVHLGDRAAPALERALTQAAYGRFLRRRGERRAAVARLETAQRELLRLGAHPFVRRCEEELQRAGSARPSPAPPPPSP